MERLMETGAWVLPGGKSRQFRDRAVNLDENHSQVVIMSMTKCQVLENDCNHIGRHTRMGTIRKTG